jgi:galactonate dehydratase
MKIQEIETIVVNAEMRNWIFVKVITDEPGLYGLGEATLEWKTRAVVGCIEDLKPLLIGKDPRDITQLNHVMDKHGFWRLGIIGRSAISGIDIALWDILGKLLGVPVWRLLGGKTHDKIKMYTHLGMGDSNAVYTTLETQPLLERARQVVEAGWKAVKVVFIPYVNYTASIQEIDHVSKMMMALREAVGDDIEIMVDFHGRPGSNSAAVQFIHALEPGRPLFVEEPIQPGDPESLRAVKDKINCPLATGERLVSAQEFGQLFALRAIDIAQPDLCHCGGFTEARRIAEMAAIHGCGIAPHNPIGPLAGVAALHYDVATPNFVIQEQMVAVPWFRDILDGQPEMVDGYMPLPTKPGLGVDLNMDVARAHPFRQEPVSFTQEARISDGTVVNW